MTHLLYMDRLENGYLKEFDAKVVEVLPDAVVLDRSLFYPLGGGQEWDTGILQAGDRRVQVQQVTKRGLVRHVVGANHGLNVGDAVHGTLDWDRRYAHMRMHTAQHLVSGLAYEMFGGVRTVGNQIHADRSRIDFNPVNFTNEMLKDLETATNDAIKAKHAVSMATMTRDAVLAEQPPERTNMDLLPKSVTELRVIRIGKDVDLCPCAGTHVQNLGELGSVEIVARSSKGSGTQRVEYVLK
jgi:misacylated tRNA(Ala) deacylase